MGINPNQFRTGVIVPALTLLGMHSPAAEAMLIGTAAQESKLGTYLFQMGKGPAVGPFQMEPNTYHDICNNFLKYHPEIQAKLATRWPVMPPAEEMKTDLLLAAVMCRLHYRRVSEALPKSDDIQGLARYWKRYYNTPQGKGSETEFVANWNNLVAGKLG